jgi:hypothetical protein
MLPEGVQSVQYQLPMSYAYKKLTFYVRDCYPQYYNYIVGILGKDEYDYISLTGTPGIGKSIFYVYFFQRYRKEYPNATIVTASFGKDRKLLKCVVFEPGMVEGVEYEKIPKIKGSLHLYDGPPEIQPSDNKMVCFTSPNYSWLDGMVKAPNHIPLYLPVWTLQELWEANELLELGIDYWTIEERFLLFGGSARYCLAFDTKFYNIGVKKLESKAKSIETFDTIKACLDEKADKADVSHQIFHYVPLFDEDVPCSFDLVFCSISIARIVDESIRDKSESKRNELVHWIKATNKSATLLGWLFEGYANEILKAGGDFELKSLNFNESCNLHLNPGEYKPAPTDNYESIDGYFTPYIFQITRNYNHPVNAKGIRKHIELLEIPNAQDLKLIFVVPKGMGDYQDQDIVLEIAPQGILSNVSAIPGIGLAGTEELHSININTAQDLKNAIENSNINTSVEVQKLLKKFKGRLERFLKSLDSSFDWHLLQNIPQYVLELEGNYK